MSLLKWIHKCKIFSLKKYLVGGLDSALPKKIVNPKIKSYDKKIK